MMWRPLRDFQCDAGDGMTSVEAGAFSWYDDGINVKDFKISHNRSDCFSNSQYYKWELLSNVYSDPGGADIFLNTIISPPNLYSNNSQKNIDIDGLYKVKYRLTIPYFEQARFYFSQAKNDPRFEGFNGYTFLDPENLKYIVETYAQ